MKRTFIFELLLIVFIFGSTSFKRAIDSNKYQDHYRTRIKEFETQLKILLDSIQYTDLSSEKNISKIKNQIRNTRSALKNSDFWLRYLEPTVYKKINGPLPVEWETEVFEKYEKPYKREAAGLTLAYLYLEETNPSKDSLAKLIKASESALNGYLTDSIISNTNTADHFFLCNRLFLLNLAAIYTTGFECPDTESIIPELKNMLKEMEYSYITFNSGFPDTKFTEEYMELYSKTLLFIKDQNDDYTQFDHFNFVKNYINPLFALNQRLIRDYKISSKSNVDYSLSKNSNSIFSKSLYRAQNTKGLFLRVNDEAVLSEIENTGKLLFYDPLLSGNNLRSCASCHKPSQFFTDTIGTTNLQFDKKNFLPRNSPSLINAPYNHLLMLDGKHLTLEDQTHAVITNPIELSCSEIDALKKVLSCEDYNKAFKKLLKYTPQEKEVNLKHISSSIIYYYSNFSKYYSDFDEAINSNKNLEASAQRGYNIFMSKAQCATCHFPPQFNGVKPPYVGSEFEVIGVPKDKEFKNMSADKGRYEVNPAKETLNAFRTGTVRNSAKTKPYMHNGVFKDMKEVIDFYDAGGGAGRGLNFQNQTLSSDSLHLTDDEKKDLNSFINSLTENIPLDTPPQQLPKSKFTYLNSRKSGGEY